LSLNLSEATVLFLLTGAAILFSYGATNVFIDVCYIYFFPFILVFYFVWITFRLVIRGYRFVWRDHEPFENPLGIVVSRPQHAATPPPPSSGADVQRDTKSWDWKKGILAFFKPLHQFTLLWCLLLLLTSHRSLLAIALAIVLFHIGRFLLFVIRVAGASTKWLPQLEERIKSYAENLIEKVSAVQEITPDLQQTWSAIVAIQIGISLLENRRRVVQWTMYLGTLFFLGVYLYLALLFSFAYYGTARLQGVSLSWASAAVYSVFIPFAFSDFPANIWVKLIAGVHATVVVLIGLGAIFGYMQKKVNSLHAVAQALNTKLQQPEIKEKLAKMKERFRAPVVAKQ
jgi:hypothetical protein